MRCVYFTFTLQTMFVGTFPFITKTMYLCIWRDVILLKRTSGCVYFTLTSQSMCTLLLHHKACVLYSYITKHVYFTLTSQSMCTLLLHHKACVLYSYITKHVVCSIFPFTAKTTFMHVVCSIFPFTAKTTNKLKIVVKLISKLSCTVHVFYIDIFVMQKI